jgi:signal transduction histidine kinase
MEPIILLILHLILYGLSPLLIVSIFRAFKSTAFFYFYFGFLYVFTQLFAVLYSIKVSEDLSITGGNIAYSSIILITFFIGIASQNPTVVRNLISIQVFFNLFLFFLYQLLVAVLNSPTTVNLFSISPGIFTTTIIINIASSVVFIIEILVLFYMLEKVKEHVKQLYLVIALYIVFYIGILCLDGFLFPFIVSFFEPVFGQFIVGNVVGKLILGIGFSPFLLVFMIIHKRSLIQFIKKPFSTRLVILPKRKQLIEKLQMAEENLRETEKKFQVLFNNAIAGIAYHTILYDAKGKPFDYVIKDVNPHYEKTLSIKREDAINKKATELYKVDNAPYLNIFSKVANTEESTIFEAFFPPMNTYFQITVLSPKKGDFITIFEDISERKKAERKLKNSKEKYRKAYERANLYKDLLTHDVNNIISVIQGATQLYSLQKNNPEKRDEMVEIVSNSTNKANRLIANIRTLFQIEEDVDVSLKSVDVLNYLNDAIKFTIDCFKGREVHITVDTPSNNIIAHANALLINVFENILNNSVKYNDNPSVEITIKISKEQKSGRNFIKIEFIDNGIGISDEFKETIFQKDHINTKGGKGLGFGLSVVKKLIKIYKGKIWIEDRIEGKYLEGSNFIVLIPVSRMKNLSQNE